MTLSDRSLWPVSGPDQDVYTDNLSKRVAKIRYAIKPIVVRKFYTPSQSDWEQAWSLKTGMYPPIPPGVKLIWYNLSTGEMEYFTVTWDLGNGTDSSGTVYPVKASTAESSCFRFLGALSRRGTPLSAFNKPDSTITTLMLDQDLWRSRGLLAIMIECSLSITAANLRLAWYSSSNSYGDDFFLEEDNPVSPYPLMSGFTTEWRPASGYTSQTTTEDTTILSATQITRFTSQTFKLPPSEYPFIGRITIGVGGVSEDEKQYFGPLASLVGATFGDAIDPGDITLYQSVIAQRVAREPLRNTISLYNTSSSLIENYDTDDMACIYGIFDSTTESELGEF